MIQGDGITVPSPTRDGKERKQTFKLDPAKSPKEIDITSLDGQEKGKTAACIYKLEKDRLTICIPYFVEEASCGICIAVCPWTRPTVRPNLLAKMAKRLSLPAER